MDRTTQKEIDLINIQEFLEVIGILVLIGAILIAENAKRRLRNDNPFWTEEEERSVSILARATLFIVAIISVIVSWQVTIINKEKNSSKETQDAGNIELIGAILAIVATGLILWAGILNHNNAVTESQIAPE